MIYSHEVTSYIKLFRTVLKYRKNQLIQIMIIQNTC